MYPRLMHVYGPLWIQSYGFMIVLGFLIFLFFTYRHPLRKQLVSGEIYLNTVFLSLIAGIIGGRVLCVLTEWSHFSHNWIEIFYPWTGGFVVLGAIVGVFITAPIYLRWHRVQILPVLDLAAVYGPLMQAIGRIGCFLAGCCYGKVAPDGTWWTITFNNYDGYLPLEIIGVSLYPTQLYAAVASLFIFFIMYFFVTRYFKRYGQWAAWYIILENCARFLVDFWRADQINMYVIPGFDTLVLSDMQLLALAAGIGGVIFLCIVSRLSVSFHE